MKNIEISLMEEDELSIDGQTKPAGNLAIREFEIITDKSIHGHDHAEWVGGSYATYDNLVEKVKEALEIDADSYDNYWQDHGGES